MYKFYWLFFKALRRSGIKLAVGRKLAVAIKAVIQITGELCSCLCCHCIGSYQVNTKRNRMKLIKNTRLWTGSAPLHIICTDDRHLETSVPFPASYHCYNPTCKYGTIKPTEQAGMGPIQNQTPGGIHFQAAVQPGVWSRTCFFSVGARHSVGNPGFSFSEWHSTHAPLGLKTQPQELHPT